MSFIVTSSGTGSLQTMPHPDTVTSSELKLTPKVCSNQEVSTIPSIVAVSESTHTSNESSGNVATASGKEMEEDIPGSATC